MTGALGPRTLLLICVLALAAWSGCADIELPYWVPFQGPTADTMPGVVTPAQRIAELRKLSNQAASGSEADKARVSQELAAAIKTEKDPLIRMEIIRALGRYPGPAADAILKAALSDADSHVRIVACEAWGKRSDEHAVKLLAEVLQGDVDADVRLAAAKALGETKRPEATAPLGAALVDADPAMQYRAVLSLQQATGKDLGNDVERWRQYVKGETPEPAPSIGERFRHIF
jgi:HEAT repeat protein